MAYNRGRPYKHDFNPRSPCGERLWYSHTNSPFLFISIHAPRAGSDPKTSISLYWLTEFQSTLPVRGATLYNGELVGVYEISIHAPRAGSDQGGVCVMVDAEGFQSTLPVRGATLFLPLNNLGHCEISIHAPRAGSDGPPI